jgi:hypothetical protein
LVVILRKLRKLAHSRKLPDRYRNVIHETSKLLVDREVLSKPHNYSVWRGAVSSLSLAPRQVDTVKHELLRQARRVFPDLVASYKYIEAQPTTYKRLYISMSAGLISDTQVQHLFLNAPRLQHELTVFRGVGLSHGTEVQHLNREAISTSSRPEIAKQYQMGKPCCLIQILVPAGTPVLNLTDPTSLEEGHLLHAEEIVLPPGGTLVPVGSADSLVFRYQLGAVYLRTGDGVLMSLERLVMGSGH